MNPISVEKRKDEYNQNKPQETQQNYDNIQHQNEGIQSNDITPVVIIKNQNHDPQLYEFLLSCLEEQFVDEVENKIKTGGITYNILISFDEEDLRGSLRDCGIKSLFIGLIINKLRENNNNNNGNGDELHVFLLTCFQSQFVDEVENKLKTKGVTYNILLHSNDTDLRVTLRDTGIKPRFINLIIKKLRKNRKPGNGSGVIKGVVGGVVCVIVIIIIVAVSARCFASDSMVWIRKNETNKIIHTTINEIEIGDYVLTMDPWTNNIFWDEILLKIHYSWYEDSNTYHSMRKLYFDNLDNNNNNISSITLSNNHFIYINDIKSNKPKIIQTEFVEIGDILFHYDYYKNKNMLSRVIDIDENVMSKKRVFFTMSPYVLVNNIVASPYTGPYPIYHYILHQLYIHLIFLRYFMNQSILSFLACFGYCLLIHWFQLFVIAFFSVLYVYKCNKQYS